MRATDDEMGTGSAAGAIDLPALSALNRQMHGDRLKVLVLDLWCYTPYYDRYLCESLRAAGIEVRLAAASYYKDPGYLERSGCENHPGPCDVVARLRIPHAGARRVLMTVESCINMLALSIGFASSRPDIIHVQWIPMAKKLPFELWFLRLARYLGIKLVYTVHNVLPQDTGDRFRSVFERVYQQMDALICHNQETANRLVREFAVPPERLWVIPHGPLFHDAQRPTVEASRARLGIGEAECVVLCQGVVDSYKGIEFLLEAWSKVPARNLNARLIIAGTGEPHRLDDLRARVTRLGIDQSVRLDLRYIPTEELPAYFQAADIITFTYRENTTSGALFTALPYGKAIVATSLPVFTEFLRDGHSALLVSYGDVRGLEDGLVRLIRDREERHRLALGAQTAARTQVPWGEIAGLTRSCYEAALTAAEGGQTVLPQGSGWTERRVGAGSGGSPV